MNKRGFTLIELLAVIIILSVIALIVMVSVSSSIDNSSEELTKVQKKTIEDAAEHYYLKEGMNNNVTCVSVRELISKGYTEGKNIIDPSTGKEMTGFVKISYEANQYTYEYKENSCSE